MSLPTSKLQRARWAVTLIFMANGLSFASIVPHFPWLQRKLELTEATMGFALLLPAVGGDCHDADDGPLDPAVW